MSDLERTLSRAERRLALRRGLVRGGWTATTGVLLLEVGLLAGDALGLAPLAAALPGALALAAAPLLVALAPRPGRRVTAAVLDARLDLGATLVTAAEALDGQHARFRAPVLTEAARALAGRSLAAALPVQAPAGLLLGGAAAALLPAVLMGFGAGSRPSTGGGAALPLLVGLDPRSSGSGAGVGADAPDAAPAPADAPLAASPLTGSADGADPLGGLAPEVAAVLRERLAEVMRALPARPDAAAAPAPADEPGEPDDDLARALRAGDAAASLRAFEDLSSAASAGDLAAARRLADLAAAERAGAGTGAAPDRPRTAPDDARTASSGAVDRGPGGARQRLPRELELATRRYFEASPGATRPTTRGDR